MGFYAINLHKGVWTDDLPAAAGRTHAGTVMLQKPGITADASQRIHDAHSSLLTILDCDMLNTITVETNPGRRVKGVDWVDVTNEELDAYIGLCILRGVYKGKDEGLRELWIQ